MDRTESAWREFGLSLLGSGRFFGPVMQQTSEQVEMSHTFFQGGGLNRRQLDEPRVDRVVTALLRLAGRFWRFGLSRARAGHAAGTASDRAKGPV